MTRFSTYFFKMMPKSHPIMLMVFTTQVLQVVSTIYLLFPVVSLNLHVTTVVTFKSSFIFFNHGIFVLFIFEFKSLNLQPPITLLARLQFRYSFGVYFCLVSIVYSGQENSHLTFFWVCLISFVNLPCSLKSQKCSVRLKFLLVCSDGT